MASLIILIYFFIFLLGLAAGSFLNCIIHRLQTKDYNPPTASSHLRWAPGFLISRSYCPHCRHQLNWQDLIPLLSFLILKGRCRYCLQKISWQYPLVELTTGILFILIFNFFTPTPNFGVGASFSIFNEFSITNFINFCFILCVSCFMIVIFVYDLKHYLIPDKVIYPAIAITFLYQLFRILNFEFVSNLGFRILDFKALIGPVFSAIFASAFFLTIVLVSRGKWMGVGDIKLAFFMGLFLSFPNILVALFLAFLIGAIIGIGLILFGKKTLKSEVPFGPFLVTGTFIALFWGEKIINWYFDLF